MKALFYLSLSLLALSARGATETTDSELYVVNPPAFRETHHQDLRVIGGYDFSNPYVHSFSLGAGVYRQVIPLVALGVEANVFRSEKRSTTKEMENKLKEYGYNVDFLAPQWSTTGAVRITPFSALMNLTEGRYTLAELAIVLRAGVVDYGDAGFSPIGGAAVEFNMGFDATWGMTTAIVFNASAPKDRPTETWMGFRAGPVIHF